MKFLFFNRKDTIFRWVLFYGILGVLFYLLDIYCPFTTDDYFYAFNKANMSPVKSLEDAIDSQLYEYFHSNGRFIIHLVVQYFCGVLGIHFFRICNTIIFILFMIQAIKLINNGSYNRFCIDNNIILTLLLLLTGTISYFLSNISISINYLWTSAFILFFFNLLFRKTNNSTFVDDIFKFLFSVFVGSLQESFSIGICGALIFWIFLNKDKIRKSEYIMAFGFALGTLTNVFAPGNFIRFSSYSGNDGSSIVEIMTRMFVCLFSSEAFSCLAVLLVILYFKNKAFFISFIRENLLLLLSVIFNILFIAFIAYTGTHQLTSIEVLSIILLVKLFNMYIENYALIRKWIFPMLVLMLLLLYVPIYHCRKNIALAHNEFIENAFHSKNGIIIADKYYRECFAKDSWFYKVFTKQEPYHKFTMPRLGLSAIITKGKNLDYINTVLPDDTSYIVNCCTDKNLLSDYVYRNINDPYYIIRIPLSEKNNIQYIELLNKPARRDFLKALLGKTNKSVKYSKEDVTSIDSFESESFVYYIVYTPYYKEIIDVRVGDL